jgi:transcription antitermination factor NusG
LLQNGFTAAASPTSGLSLVAAVRTDRAPCGWYAVSTTPRHEKQVAEYFQIRDVEHYLPLYRADRRWRDGSRVTLELPLFPCYIFVRITLCERLRVLQTPGVIGIVNGVGREPAPIADEQMESLRDGLAVSRVEPHPFLVTGQRGRIRSGALAGMEGVLVRIGKSSKVVLTMELIMRSVAVEIAADNFEVLPRVS